MVAVARTGRRRLVAFVVLCVAIAAGLGIHYGLSAGAFSDISGDALYALAAYLGIIVLAPRWPPLLVGGVALAWCVAVELLQLTGLPLRAGAVFAPAQLLLGTGFDPRDLVVYAVAVVVAVAGDTRLRRPLQG